MSASDPLLAALLDSWDRNHRILIHLLRAIPSAGLTARALETSPTVARMFAHIHGTRLFFLAENAPEFARPKPSGGWLDETNAETLAAWLDESARAVRDAVRHRIVTRQPMAVRYDHPLLLLQHQIWHEGYHHGQIKLALKLAGQPLADEQIGPLTWAVWMKKSSPQN